MDVGKDLAKKIVEVSGNVDGHELLVPFDFGSGDSNELLMFIKPEVFMDADKDSQVNAVSMMLDKLDDFGVNVRGSAVVSGKVLEDKEIMNNHYGYINQMSRRGSELVSSDDISIIQEKLGLDDIEDYEILGGHELLEIFNDLNSSDLDAWWFEGGSEKVRSGFYVRADERDGRKVVMINAFHPEQLAHFTRPDRRIALFLLESARDWDELRTVLIGETFPEKAVADSIRGTLYRNPSAYGFESVSIANNAVHMSAGPVEALFEIDNFLGKILDIDISKNNPSLVREMLNHGLDINEALEVLSNPLINLEDLVGDLHSVTEHKNARDAVKIWVTQKQKLRY